MSIELKGGFSFFGPENSYYLTNGLIFKSIPPAGLNSASWRSRGCGEGVLLVGETIKLFRIMAMPKRVCIIPKRFPMQFLGPVIRRIQMIILGSLPQSSEQCYLPSPKGIQEYGSLAAMFSLVNLSGSNFSGSG